MARFCPHSFKDNLVDLSTQSIDQELVELLLSVMLRVEQVLEVPVVQIEVAYLFVLQD